jgi:amino acid transporter
MARQNEYRRSGVDYQVLDEVKREAIALAASTAYLVFVGLDLILFGATLNGIILAHGGPDIPWWLLMLIGLVVIWGVAVLGIRLSVRSDLALLTFEIGVLFALALTILAKGAPGGDWHPHVFTASASPTGFSGVVVGAVFGVLAFGSG